MACDDTITSPGVILKYDLDGTPPYVSLGDVIDVSGPGETVESKEKTNLNSAARFKEFCPGFADGGEVTFTLKMNKATVALLVSLRFVSFYLQLVWPTLDDESTPSDWICLGFITARGEEHPADGGQCTIPVTFKISGEPEFTQGV